jgi:hypothetical protein
LILDALRPQYNPSALGYTKSKPAVDPLDIISRSLDGVGEVSLYRLTLPVPEWRGREQASGAIRVPPYVSGCEIFIGALSDDVTLCCAIHSQLGSPSQVIVILDLEVNSLGLCGVYVV